MQQIYRHEDLTPETDILGMSRGAVTDAATRCNQSGHNPGVALRQLDLPAICDELDMVSARMLLFHTAYSFGAIDVETTWEGLAAACDTLASDTRCLKTGAVALEQSGSGWTHYQPGQSDATIFLLERRKNIYVLRPASPGKTTALLGFPRGQMTLYKERPTITSQDVTLSAENVTSWLNGQAALILGLIAGATTRIVDEAYIYAGQRKSGGRVIAQYQAVALRLADLAIHQRALFFLADALVAQMKPDGDTDFQISVAATLQITDLAFQVSRDALQTAAGHGYVSGLPFRPTYEKLRSLCAVLDQVTNALLSNPEERR